jgi:penicillin amidase
MAWINSVNLREELTFLRLAERLGNARALELFPVDVGVPPPEDAARLPMRLREAWSSPPMPSRPWWAWSRI